MQYLVIGEYGPIAAMAEREVIEASSADEAKNLFAEKMKSVSPYTWSRMGMHNITVMPYVEPELPKGPRYQILDSCDADNPVSIIDTHNNNQITVSMRGYNSTIAALITAEALNNGYDFYGSFDRFEKLLYARIPDEKP